MAFKPGYRLTHDPRVGFEEGQYLRAEDSLESHLARASHLIACAD